MHTNELADAFQHLKALEFPSAPDDPDIADWIMELLEIDGHYAGLATTALAGGRVSPPGARDLDELREWLGGLRAATSEDELVLEQCHAYFKALDQLHARLRP